MLKSMRRRVVTALCAMCLVSALWVLPINAAEAFDPVFYAALYPDLATALGTDPQVLLNHYLNYGMKEGCLTGERSPGPRWTESRSLRLRHRRGPLSPGDI